MPTVDLTVQITVDGQPVVGFPIVRRTESPATATGEITDRLTTSSAAIDAAAVGVINVLFLQSLDGVVTLGLNGASIVAASAPILNPKGMVLLFLTSILEATANVGQSAATGTTILQQFAGATPTL